MEMMLKDQGEDIESLGKGRYATGANCLGWKVGYYMTKKHTHQRQIEVQMSCVTCLRETRCAHRYQ